MCSFLSRKDSNGRIEIALIQLWMRKRASPARPVSLGTWRRARPRLTNTDLSLSLSLLPFSLNYSHDPSNDHTNHDYYTRIPIHSPL